MSILESTSLMRAEKIRPNRINAGGCEPDRTSEPRDGKKPNMK